MKIRDVMTPNPFTLSPECSIQDAAAMFLEHGIDGAPVIDDSAHLLGLVTKMHLYRAIVDQQPLNLPVHEIMSTQIHTLEEDMPIKMFHELIFRRYPVISQGKVVGMVTKSDQNDVLLKELKDVGHQMEAVLEGA